MSAWEGVMCFDIFREGSGSNLLVVPAGSVLTEALISSAVCRGEDGGSAPVVGAGGGFEFGVDPEDDPDLALVSPCQIRTFIRIGVR